MVFIFCGGEKGGRRMGRWRWRGGGRGLKDLWSVVCVAVEEKGMFSMGGIGVAVEIG